MSVTAENIQNNRSLGEMISALYDLRERKRAMTTLFNALDKNYRALEAEIISAMDAQDTELARSSKASASISEQLVPNIVDRDAFNAYLKETDQLHLYQNRIVATAWRELIDSGEEVPGTEPFKKRTLSLRAR